MNRGPNGALRRRDLQGRMRCLRKVAVPSAGSRQWTQRSSARLQARAGKRVTAAAARRAPAADQVVTRARRALAPLRPAPVKFRFRNTPVLSALTGGGIPVGSQPTRQKRRDHRSDRGSRGATICAAAYVGQDRPCRSAKRDACLRRECRASAETAASTSSATAAQAEREGGRIGT